MKTINIIILVVIAIAIAIFAGAYGDSSTYTDFATARKNAGQEYHIVGKLNKEKPMVYNPLKNANRFEFFQKSDGDFIASKILLKCPSKYEAETAAK